MTPTPQPGAMEQWVHRHRRVAKRVQDFVLCRDLEPYAREQDAALAALTRQRDELLAGAERFYQILNASDRKFHRYKKDFHMSLSDCGGCILRREIAQLVARARGEAVQG